MPKKTVKKKAFIGFLGRRWALAPKFRDDRGGHTVASIASGSTSGAYEFAGRSFPTAASTGRSLVVASRAARRHCPRVSKRRSFNRRSSGAAVSLIVDAGGWCSASRAPICHRAWAARRRAASNVPPEGAASAQRAAARTQEPVIGLQAGHGNRCSCGSARAPLSIGTSLVKTLYYRHWYYRWQPQKHDPKNLASREPS